jgi:hypothetical protein
MIPLISTEYNIFDISLECKVGLSVLEKLIKCEANVFSNLTEQDRGNVSNFMKWNRCAAARRIAELFV